MPVIQILSPQEHPPAGLLDELCDAIARAMGIPTGHAWAIWQGLDRRDVSRPEWREGSNAPVVFVRCKDRYSREKVGEVMRAIQRVLSDGLGCPPEQVYVAVQRVIPHELLVRGAVWEGDDVAGEALSGRIGSGTR